MNKFIKYMAIVFAVALSVGIIGGCVATLVAVVQGITRNAGFDGTDVNGAVYHDEDGSLVVFGIKIGGMEETVSFTETFEEEEIRSVSVDTGAEHVIITTGDKFEVVFENVPKGYKAEVKNGVLSVYKESRSFLLFSFGFFAPASKITVTVPEGFMAEQFCLDSGSGSMEMTRVLTDRLILDAGSGSVLLREIAANRTNINTGSGRVEISDAELGVAEVDSGSGSLTFSKVATKNLAVDSGSGRVTYEGTMVGSCMLETGSGSVSIILNAYEKDYNITADMGSGSFYLNGKKMKDVDIRNGEAENTIVFDCGSGRVSLEFTKE